MPKRCASGLKYLRKYRAAQRERARAQARARKNWFIHDEEAFDENQQLPEKPDKYYVVMRMPGLDRDIIYDLLWAKMDRW